MNARTIIGCSAIILVALTSSVRSAAGGPSSSFNLVLPITPVTASMLNQTDSHQWTGEPWGGTSTLTWKSVHDRQAMHLAFTSTGGTEAYLRTDFFAPENWSAVTSVKIDVYVENGKANLGLRLELKGLDGATLTSGAVDPGVIPAGGWSTVTLTWTAPVSGVSQLFLIPTNLNNGDAVCFSNLRLSGGAGDDLWDTFETPSYGWRGAQDFRFWKTNGQRNEPVSHLQTDGSADALYFPWQFNEGTAKLEAVNLYYNNLQGVSKIRARVRHSRTDAPIFLGFWDGSHWLQTPAQNVSAADTWTQLEWTRPAGDFSWGDIVSFMFLVQTAAGGTGDLFIDHLEFQ